MAKFEVKNGVGIITEGTIVIDSYAFMKCTGLKDIVIPSSVTEIGERAFSHCSSLKKITIDGKLYYTERLPKKLECIISL